MVFPGPWRWAHHLLAKLAKIPGIEADLISCNSLLGGCPWDMALHEPWLGLAWFGLVWPGLGFSPHGQTGEFEVNKMDDGRGKKNDELVRMVI